MFCYSIYCSVLPVIIIAGVLKKSRAVKALSQLGITKVRFKLMFITGKVLVLVVVSIADFVIEPKGKDMAKLTIKTQCYFNRSPIQAV